MAGLCESSNEPAGSLKATGLQNVHDEERSGRPTIITDDLVYQSTICLLMTRLRDFGPDRAVQWEIRITAY
ncbi:hypothetical protein ANN_09336 [Periplaneta americana]|uniref:Uncharacterized protein n=1 Tax=Periplaneta americana TaxID=6978 RepID=A0ABQ8TNK4_PERAM|nr:hypothetical protein ANN_09336 [Periplaneta americana]